MIPIAYLGGQRSERRVSYLVFHRIITGAMVLTLIWVVVLHFALSNWNHIMIVVKTALIVEFTIYGCGTPSSREKRPFGSSFCPNPTAVC